LRISFLAYVDQVTFFNQRELTPLEKWPKKIKRARTVAIDAAIDRQHQ
jgi:hypothetical protein